MLFNNKGYLEKNQSNMIKEKIYYLKIILTIFLFNILPFSCMFIGFLYLNVLENKTQKIELKMKNALSGETISKKEKILENLQQEVLKYIDNLSDYNKKIKELNNTIVKIEEQNIKINDDITKKENEVTNLKNKNNELTVKYKMLSNYEIKNVITINQYPLYPNGCEGIALTILLKYYGISVTPQSVMDALPKGEIPYEENGVWYGGNPNYEFLGYPSSIYGWGIWDKGLALTANKFKSGVINGTGMDFNSILKLVRNNRPVIVWTSINLRSPNIGKSWIYKPTGEVITWKRYNHAVVVIGYTENTVIISDPINGQKRSMNRQTFINVYNYMGKKAIYY